MPYPCLPTPFPIPRLWGSAGGFCGAFRMVENLLRNPHTELQRFCRTLGATPPALETPSFLSLFFGKWPGKPPKKTRIFYSYRTPKIPGKEGENAQKNKEFLAKEKNKEFQKNKERKDRVETLQILLPKKTARIHCVRAQNRRRTNVQQLTCNTDLSNYF